MASVKMVNKMLGAFQRNYSRRATWAEDSRASWMYALKGYQDEDCQRVAAFIMHKRASVPSVAVFLEALGSDPRTTKKEAPAGCTACEASGWREVAWHRYKNGRLIVTTYAAACDCSKGERYAGGAAMPWREVVDRYRNDPNTDKVYHTTAAVPRLTMEQRYHPEILKRIKDANNSTRQAGSFTQVMGSE